MESNIVEVSQENAQSILIERSNEQPVVIQFYSPRSPDCEALTPILEKIAGENPAGFTLARVNVDELMPIAQQLGVQGLPTVMVMIEGRPADGFAGPQEEEQVREVLSKHLPAPWQEAIDQANALMAEDKFDEALPLLSAAYQQSDKQSSIGIGLAQVYLHLNLTDSAEELLGAIPMVDQDAAYEQAMAQLKLKLEAAESPEIKQLEEQFQSNPEDFGSGLRLAVQYHETGKNRDALEVLIGILRKNLGAEEGAVKKAMTDILAALGKGDPLAIEFQRKLFTLLY